MQCIKCGRDSDGAGVFCSDCLEDMKKSPVDPNVRINIIPRSSKRRSEPSAQSQKQDQTAQIAALKRRIRNLRAGLLVMCLLLAAAVGFICWQFTSEDGPSIGQNYSTMDNESTP